jgi:phospholipid-binding lipoprotein MlaA
MSHLNISQMSARLAMGLALMAGLLLSTGCATHPGGDPRDPIEPFNRSISNFNDAADRVVLKPIATGYVQLVPDLVRTGVNNFFSNLGDAWTFVNTVLQLKPQEAGETAIRFGVNTLFGLGGLLDIASEAGIPKHNEDFGLTLGRWGVGAGPYIVLPLLGPSTLRDTVAFGVETNGNVLRRIDSEPLRSGLYVLDAVDTRATYLGAGNVLEEAALDKYSFTRDIYLQRRRSLITGGESSPEQDDPAADESKK